MDCFERLRLAWDKHHYVIHDRNASYAEEVWATDTLTAARRDCDRAARNLAFAIACVACLDFAQSVWPGELPLAPMRRAGLWKER